MNPINEDIAKASKKIGLTDSQANNFWQALQEIRADKSKSIYTTALLYFGAIIVLLSMTWFYNIKLVNSYSLVLSIAYALIFLGAGAYFWFAKKLRIPGGLLSTLGIFMVPLIVYSLQHVMHWWPTLTRDNYINYYQWVHGHWLIVEICTLLIACLVLYFIRSPFITIPIYSTLSFMSIDAIDLLVDLKKDKWIYYCIASITIGFLINVLAFILYRKGQKDFGFWSYLFGMFLLWSGLTALNIRETEWGNFIYLLINVAFILLSKFFHRKIFLIFGYLGIIFYIGYLALIHSGSLMLPYVVGAIGFFIIMLATFLLLSKKRGQIP